MNETKESIYEKLGGEAAFELAVENFYKKVLSDDLLKDFFAETNMTTQKKHQKNFLMFACGGPNNYVGRDMRSSHAKFQLNDEHFDAVVKHLVATLKELNVSDEIIGEIGAKIEPLRPEVLNR